MIQELKLSENDFSILILIVNENVEMKRKFAMLKICSMYAYISERKYQDLHVCRYITM